MQTLKLKELPLKGALSCIEAHLNGHNVLYCPSCDAGIFASWVDGWQIKAVYCPVCGAELEHVEV